MAQLFAHMGGLDEIALFALPAAAIILFLRRAERRARERAAGDEMDDVEESGID